MPNWCDNDITITGPEEELKRFKELAETPKPDPEWVDTKFNTHALLGISLEEYLEICAKRPRVEFPAWFFWGELAWSETKKGAKSLSGFYQTRWANKDNTLAAISAKFPSLRIANKYEEGMMCFKGRTTFLNGKEVSRTYKEWQTAY
jgi:hypothetical protein